MLFKKVGEIFLTERTIQNNFSDICIVESDEEIYKQNSEIVFKNVNGIKYFVYAESRQVYDKYLNKVKFKSFYYEK